MAIKVETSNVFVSNRAGFSNLIIDDNAYLIVTNSSSFTSGESYSFSGDNFVNTDRKANLMLFDNLTVFSGGEFSNNVNTSVSANTAAYNIDSTLFLDNTASAFLNNVYVSAIVFSDDESLGSF